MKTRLILFTFSLLLFIAAKAQLPAAYTMGHDPITGHDFNLYGAVNAMGDTGVYKFVYSTDSTFTVKSSTAPQPFGGSSLNVVYATVPSLTPASTYYYFIKATTNQGSTTGQVMKFYSDTVNLVFENNGGDVFPGQAFVQLNGRLSKFQTNLTLYFEYGETPDLGTQIVPDVTTVSDSLTHYFRAFPGSVVAGKLYFFRAKAVAATDTFYSDIRGFYTGTGAYTIFQSLSASPVSDTDATFNGQSQGFQLPLKHQVEFFNNSLGHYHSPYTYYAPSPALNNYQFRKGGLLPGHYYQTRFKAETWIGNYYSDSAFTTTGVNGIKNIVSDKNISIYPNPSSDLMMFEISDAVSSESRIQIYNLNGQLQKEVIMPAGNTKTTFTVADMESGFYLLRWVNGVEVAIKKIAVIK